MPEEVRAMEQKLENSYISGVGRLCSKTMPGILSKYQRAGLYVWVSQAAGQRPGGPAVSRPAHLSSFGGNICSE